ncbi:MAG: FAD-dependent oxidoreductase [Leptonema sp. (in: bacteria)]
MKQYQSDVVIIGGGLAGISTALEILNSKKNAKVILIEKSQKEGLGGLARKSFGGIFLNGTKEQKKMGIQDSPELAYQDWLSFAEFEEDDHYGKEWAKEYVYNNLDYVYHWLRGKKIQFFPVVHWVERGLFKPGNSVPRFHMVWGTGYELMKVLTNELFGFLDSNSLQIFFETKIETIFLDSSQTKVMGCGGIHLNTKENFEIQTPIIVVASGGITGNLDLVRKNWGYNSEIPKILLNGSQLESDGELHFELEKKGALLHKIYRQWNYAAGVHHPKAKFPEEGLSLVPVKSGLWVNVFGERIGNPPLVSGFDTLYLVREILKQAGGYSWHIMNYKIAKKELAVSGSEFNEAIRDKKLLQFLSILLFGNKKLLNTLMNHCIDFVTANSLEELVKKMNELQTDYKTEYSILQRTIQNYDSMIERGYKFLNDDQLRRIMHLRNYRGDKIRTCKFQRILDKNAFPLIAIRLHILTRKTLGGILTNLQSRVLNKNFKEISGLYAVGETAGFGGGGIHGIRSLEGTFLGSCIFTGRIAGQDIIKNL